MKKVRFALLIVLIGSASLFACEECRKKELAAKQGVLFPGWKVAPLQMGLGIDGWRGLADKDGDTVFTFGWYMWQNSAVFSLCALSGLKSNYGIQLSLLIADAKNNYGLQIALTPEARTNYGLMLGLLTAVRRRGNYGFRIGILNVSGKVEEIQFIGVNCFDLLHLALVNQGDNVCQIGLANFTRGGCNSKGYFQLGVFNSGDTAFQIGLLNYNPNSYIPYLPLVNFRMMPKEEEHSNCDTITVTVVESDGKKEAVYLPAR